MKIKANELKKRIEILGYSQQEVDAALDLLEDFPLDDDQLEEIAGGFVSVKPFTPNTSMPKNPTSSFFI